MSFLRPEVHQRLIRGREVLAATAAGLFGLWVFAQGGWLLWPVGAAIIAVALGWGVAAFRRMRFRNAVDAPGLVEIDEAQIGYFGPSFGGHISLDELAQIRLVGTGARRAWRLSQGDGQTLLIPVGSTGADLLIDAFATLPGMDLAGLLAALDAPAALTGSAVPVAQSDRLVWTRVPRFAVVG